MLQKFTFSLLLAITVFSFSVSNATEVKKHKPVALDGSEIGLPNNNKIQSSIQTDFSPLNTTSFTVSYAPFGNSGFYDLQSNSTTNEIWQDPINPNNVHAVFMTWATWNVAPRLVNYFLSIDRGVTWSYLGNVTESQSGFPSIDGFNTGEAVVSTHTTAGGVAAARTQVFADLGAGFGSFQRLDPGQNAGADMIWGRVVTTGSTSNPVKFVNSSSQNTAAGAPTNVATINGTSLTPPGAFGPYNSYLSDNAEQYSLALGQDGRIGNAYILDELTGQGDVAFRESMDGGATWSAPQIIFDANPAVDSNGAFRGINIVYLGNKPCVTFEVIKLDPAGVFPTLPSKIMFWSPTINGGVAKTVASEANIPFYPNNGPSATYGVYFAICRPAIGKTNSAASNTLFLSMNATTQNINPVDSNNYYATYFMVSPDGGATWGAPEKITPTSPLKDYRYASMSKINGTNAGNTEWSVQMMVQAHDYAGAFSPAEPPAASTVVGIRVAVPFVKINEISSIVPSDFNLQQNYPNPFNPTTSIRFDIVKSSRVTLKIYNSNGQEVTTLINNENVTPGTKEVSFNASGLGSGIYFYTLFAGDIRETKKMMLIK